MVGSQIGRGTSLGSMTRLLRCGTLPASRTLGVLLGQTMTTTYHLECMRLLVVIFFADGLCSDSVRMWNFC